MLRKSTSSRLISGIIACGMALGVAQGLTLYDFGNPTPEEQLYLELINRARANPAAEGARLAGTTDQNVLAAYTQFGVDLAMMRSEFNALPVSPPLAPNAKLTSTARSHSSWMWANATQSHDETNPNNTMTSRATAAGYSYTALGENIYAYAESVWYGHAGFQVDWGSPGTGGMQAGRGHRANIHSGAFREIGVGMYLGSNGNVGPQLVTQDFGKSSSNPTLTTGVAYYDLNQNNFYDLGEGIAGLTVQVSGADVTQYCNTAVGGGWVVPVPATAATRNVIFSGLGVNQSVPVTVPASTNAKADLKLSYQAPVITSAATATANSQFTFTFGAVGGATSYQWNRYLRAGAPPENCESTAMVTASTTGSYALLNTAVRFQGNSSFHLENSNAASQSFELNGLYFGLNTPSLNFQSMVGYATTAETFKVQVKEEGSLAWQDVFSQSGTNGPGEASFNARSAALAAMAGKMFRVRFLLNYAQGGSYYPQSGSDMGWLIDAITFNSVDLLTTVGGETLATTSGVFTPSAGNYLMQVMPTISGRMFPGSYQNFTVTTAAAPTPPSISSQPAPVTIASGSTATFSVTATGSSLSYQWYLGTSGDTANPVTAATAASITSPALTATTSYWVRVSNSAGAVNSTTATATIITVPIIISQPAPTVIRANTSATLSVVADSPLAMSYQWYAGGKKINGATSAIYNTPLLTASNSYSVSVTNSLGTTASEIATVTIAVAPAIVTHPAPLTISAGTPATLSISVSGTSPVIQWYEGASGDRNCPISGATNTAFTTPALTASTSFWAEATNVAGTAASQAAAVTVQAAFTAWGTTFEEQVSLPAGTLVDQPLADFDHDGRSNLLEYAFGASPVQANDRTPREPAHAVSATHYVLRFQRDTQLSDLQWVAEASSDLSHWHAPGSSGAPPEFSDQVISNDGGIETHEARVPRSAGKVFMRLRITRQ